jgi:FtsZ-binding cell division protein ZapB
MPAKLPTIIKSLVIQQWLEGKPRDVIAAESSLSAGTVTNLVNEWRQALGLVAADELRDLAITLKKVGITPTQCAVGFRVAMIMSRIGVKEDNIEPFITDIYNRCKDLGMSPDTIADHLKDLIEFSKTTVPLSQIPSYIKQKEDEKTKLEKEIQKLKEEIGLLDLEKSDSETSRDILLQNERMTVAELRWYSNVKAELGKHGIPVNDISEFVKTVNGIKQHGYDPDVVTSEFSDYQSHINRHRMFKDSLQGLENKYNNLNQQCSFFEQLANSHSQAITVHKQLENMGFGLKELKLLWHTINEIAAANEIPLHEAPQKFYKDIADQYDNKLGFESTIEKLRFELNNLSKEESRLRLILLEQPLIGPMLIRLIQSGVKEQDIIHMVHLFERDSTSGIIDMQLFIAELDKYGSIKSAIQKLKQEEDKLGKDVVSLQTQKQDLDTYNQKLVFDSVNSKQIIYYYHGLVDSLRNETLGLFSFVALIMNYLLNLRLEELDKLNGLAKFMPLMRADRGEAVPVMELKMALIKAIGVIIDKINANGDKRLAEILSEARLELTRNNQQ